MLLYDHKNFGGGFIYTYFSMLKSVADLDPTEYCIKDLTIALAKSGGYYRDLYTFKNGSIRERTLYTKTFDNILTAKWLCYYKKLFISKLSCHPEFAEYHVDIIDRVFHITMTSVNLDKIINDRVINKYVNSALSSRIAEVIWAMGSNKRLDEFFNGGKRKFKLKTAFNHQATSIEQLIEDGTCVDTLVEDQLFDTQDDLLNELQVKLADNRYGLLLLNSMLHTDKRVQLNNIDKFVPINHHEIDNNTKQDLVDAYNTILCTLKSYVVNPNKYKWRLAKNVSFSSDTLGGA